MGLPVVITKDISDDSSIIKEENIGYVLKELTLPEYTNACKKIETLINNKDEINKRIRNVAIKYRSYSIANEIYRNVYN